LELSAESRGNNGGGDERKQPPLSDQHHRVRIRSPILNLRRKKTPGKLHLAGDNRERAFGFELKDLIPTIRISRSVVSQQRLSCTLASILQPRLMPDAL